MLIKQRNLQNIEDQNCGDIRSVEYSDHQGLYLFSHWMTYVQEESAESLLGGGGGEHILHSLPIV